MNLEALRAKAKAQGLHMTVRVLDSAQVRVRLTHNMSPVYSVTGADQHVVADVEYWLEHYWRKPATLPRSKSS